MNASLFDMTSPAGFVRRGQPHEPVATRWGDVQPLAWLACLLRPGHRWVYDGDGFDLGWREHGPIYQCMCCGRRSNGARYRLRGDQLLTRRHDLRWREPT